jgi:hypothetical protein
MKRLEAIADAVAVYHHYWEPESEAYELRNPGLLIGEEGKRKFSCHRAGYASFLDRIQKYCAAHPDETIVSLLDSLGIKMRQQQKQTIDFMSRCANSAVKTETQLQWFIE